MKKSVFLPYYDSMKEVIGRHFNDGKVNPKDFRSAIEKKLSELKAQGGIKGDVSKELFYFLYLHYVENDMLRENPDEYPEAMQQAKVLFEKVFQEDLEKSPPHDRFVSAQVLKFSGLEDIESFDHRQATYGLSPEEALVRIPSIKNRLIEQIDTYSKYDINLLILGETGTSKGLLAEAIHKLSVRRSGPFRKINCAAIPENLLESELFGHVKGSFTDAKADKKGLIEMTQGGTLFLDEISKMSKSLQAKLLGVLEDSVFYPLGSAESKKINVRFLAAAQPADIKRKILPDLLYRFNYPMSITLPSLNERIKLMPDIVVKSSAGRALSKLKIDKKIFIPTEVLSVLQNHTYRGNYRELEAILMRAIISAQLDGRDSLSTEDISFPEDAQKEAKGKRLHESMESLEQINFKDIIAYANSIRASIVDKKVSEVVEKGQKPFVLLKKEGLSQANCQRFLREIKRITGKGVRDYGKQ